MSVRHIPMLRDVKGYMIANIPLLWPRSESCMAFDSLNDTVFNLTTSIITEPSPSQTYSAGVA